MDSDKHKNEGTPNKNRRPSKWKRIWDVYTFGDFCRIELKDRLMIIATLGLLAVAGITGIVFARQATLMEDQLKEMQSQTKILSDQATQAATQWEAEHRPWVGSGEIEFKKPPVFLVYPGNPMQGRTQVSFIMHTPIKNFGNSPAFHVETEVAGTMTEQIAAPPTMDTMMKSACSWADGNSRNVGGVMFPNSPETRLEQNENIMTPLIQINNVHRVWIAICIAYSGTTSGKQLHHTKIWMASWPIDGQPTETFRTAQPTVIYYSLPITRWGVVRTEAD